MMMMMVMMMMMMMMMTWKMNKSYILIYLEYEIYFDDDVKDDSDMMNLTFKKYIKVVILEFFL